MPCLNATGNHIICDYISVITFNKGLRRGVTCSNYVPEKLKCHQQRLLPFSQLKEVLPPLLHIELGRCHQL